MKIILFLAILTLLSIGSSKPINQTQLWFDYQLTDHFNITNNRTWSQRYWVNEENFNPINGSVILYICGESTCHGITQGGLFPLVLAESLNSLVIYIEHRYYGESLPFGDQSLKMHNLYYLNADQALADLAYFISYVKENNLHGIQAHNPWLTIGGSYSGALSAWFRYKYPHLTVGALGSSAVVNPIVNYTYQDEQTRLSALRSSERCAQSIRNLSLEMEKWISTPLGAQQIKSQFGAEHLNNGEFLYYYADLFTDLIQYGKRTYLCEDLLKSTDINEQYAAVVKFALDTDQSTNFYSSYYLRNDTYDPEKDGSRQWTWQYCTEFGFFQTCSSPETGMRSTQVDFDMFTKLCEDTFYQGIFPNAKRVNIQYGDLHLKATNLVLTNAIEDPWRWAGLQNSNGTIQSYLIDCDDCAHCVDLHTPKDTDAPSLKETRANILQHFSQWIGEHYNNLRTEERQEVYSFIKNQLIKS